MLGILLIFLLTAACLSLLFWVGSMFLQGYLYTQPSQSLHWQAPTAGVLLASFITGWCVLILYSTDADPSHIPYDTIFRFSATEDLGPEPVKELKLVPKKGGEAIVYKRHKKDQYRVEYKNDAKKPWEENAQAILIKHNGEEMRFEPVESSKGENQRFVTKNGWTLEMDASGTNGKPTIFRTGRFLINIGLNVLFLTLCFACASLVLRFLPSHGLLIAVILWVLTTLTLLPILFSYAADVSQKRRLIRPPAAKVSLVPTVEPSALG